MAPQFSTLYTALNTLCVSPTAVLTGTGLNLKEEWLWEWPSQSTRHCRLWGSCGLSIVTSVYAPEPTHCYWPSISTPVHIHYCTFNVIYINYPHSAVSVTTTLETEEHWQWQRVWESTTQYRVWSKRWTLHVISGESEGGRREGGAQGSHFTSQSFKASKKTTEPGTWLYIDEGGVALGKVPIVNQTLQTLR